MNSVTLDEYRGDSDLFVDARDVADIGGDPRVFEWAGPSAGDVFEDTVDVLDEIAHRAQVLVAQQYRLIADVLADAAVDPAPWVGPDPTLDPSWVDARGRTTAMVRRDRAQYAVRAAAADIGVRLRIAENTVHSRAHSAQTLRRRCPTVWDGFVAGRVGEPNAVTAAALADTFPDGAAATWQAFDHALATVAEQLTPGKFRLYARVARERTHPESIADRHAHATERRAVWLSAELDGMATLCAHIPAADAHAALTRVDTIATHLSGQDGETRTRTQLRADALIDLLRRGDGPGESEQAPMAPARPSVAITVPVLTLLGEGDQPAMLAGYGPIDPDTARRLAGDATSWIRILTHPITGTVLDVDRTTYRVPADLRRWLTVTHPNCVFPGCRRPSSDCDVDHITDWQHGGTTTRVNLAPLCGAHHHLKHDTLWSITRNPATDTITWTSPTGHTADPDPPPF